MSDVDTSKVDMEAVRAAIDGPAPLPEPPVSDIEMLRNKGVPITLRPTEGDGEVIEYLRVSLNFMADVELEWGSIDAWREDLEKRPAFATRKSIAMLLNTDQTAIGDRMIGTAGAYQDALVLAWVMANGMDPRTAAALRLAHNDQRERHAKAEADAMVAMMSGTASPSTPG